MLWNVLVDDERNLTVEQFCAAENMSEHEFDELQRNGLGPKTIWLLSKRDKKQKQDPHQQTYYTRIPARMAPDHSGCIPLFRMGAGE